MTRDEPHPDAGAASAPAGPPDEPEPPRHDPFAKIPPVTDGEGGSASESAAATSSAATPPADDVPVERATALPDERGAAEPEPPVVAEPPAPPVVDVTDLDWDRVRRAVDPDGIRARMPETVARMERLLDDRVELLFDRHRSSAGDRAIAVAELDPGPPLWFVGDLHGDLLALEAALALVRREGDAIGDARLVLLGDLFDDGGYGLELLLRVFELIAAVPGRVCLVAGNHDEALRFDGGRFSATVSPSDFTDFLNAHLEDEWIRRAGIAAIRLFERAPRALFLPDGLLVAHGGIPLADLHAELLERGDWNDPRCLQDFVWTRAHPRARRKIPNRVSRGSQFGHEDFADFCAVSERLGRPVRRMVRGHDHEEERFATYPAWAAHPILTTVALSRRLPRESFGPDTRVPTMARWVPGTLPQVHRLHVPPGMVRELFRADLEGADAGEGE